MEVCKISQFADMDRDSGGEPLFKQMDVAILMLVVIFPSASEPIVRVSFWMSSLVWIFHPKTSALTCHFYPQNFFGIREINIEKSPCGKRLLEQMRHNRRDEMDSLFIVGVCKIDAGESNSRNIAQDTFDHAANSSAVE